MSLAIPSVLLILSMLIWCAAALVELRRPDLVFLLLLIATILYLLAILSILFVKTKLKYKVFWSLIFLACWPLVNIITPSINKIAYQQYFRTNEAKLKALATLMASEDQYLHIKQDKIETSLTPLDLKDSLQLMHLFEELELSMASKDDCVIFFEIWGMLDNRRGVYYEWMEDSTCLLKVPKIARLDDRWYCPIGVEPD